MAAPEPRVRERPLSPHLQVYRWQVQMVTSIIHRATGVILSVGALALVYGLLALAGGPARWNAFAICLGSPLGKLLMFGFSWALAYHLINGIRHLLQDGGLGFAIPDFIRSSWISIIGSVVLTVLAWGMVLTRWGQA
ncbi:succinate dehydrogenase, cytochrome b556 subunit [Thermomonas sp. XSG]|jgi:succinate dehydrogenase / fumarate reductase cytochrome b subunit|uniref:succinate dehydrogenase, cytochrome b556 subunit n=1 Tax=Thermomonas sp. XSG TaxID=2771436 RepID=UPI0016813B3B|nr:succinate dehydrogenase, cytochrome b556 subunit [Thermomonas sp. XSG]QNU16260.1 succinate dehydrogenase, cytochrome b556 subunit [Thermomonas sp. XSG]